MDSPMKQAAKLMQAKKSGSRKLALFLCLAIAVTAGTTLVFKLNAQAKEHRVRVLNCAYELHQHTEDCYPGGDTDADPVCGLAELVVHVHNDADCYNEASELVCLLEELEEHAHDESCYTRQLACELEEGEGHEHGLDCYAPAEGTQPACGLEEREAVAGHTHGDACYTGGESTRICNLDEGAGAVPGHVHTESCYTEGEGRTELTCGQEESEEHAHGEGCYTFVPGERVQTCGLDEGAGAVPGHVHDASCYETSERVLTCTLEEVEPVEGHAHTIECYAEENRELVCELEEGEGHTHGDACYGEPELTCEKPEIELHIHSEENGCYAELTEEEKEAGLEHGALTCEKLQVEEHNHTEECFVTEILTAEDLELEAKPVVEDRRLEYADEDILITVEYDTNARLPGDAGIALISADTPAPELDPTQEAVLVPQIEEKDEPADGAASTEDAASDAAATGDAASDATPAEGENTPDTTPTEGGNTPDATPTEGENTPDTENTEPAGEDADAEEAPAVEGMVRAGFVDESGREWRPAATVTYTVQYLMDGHAAGEPKQYHYTPGGELPSFPRRIESFTQTVETDEFIVTATYTALAQLDGAELYAAPITEEEAVADYAEQYREAVNSSRAQMHALMDIGFMLNGEEVQPAAPVEITVQLLGEDGLPAGEPLTVVHFGAEGNDVIPAEADESGTAAFKLNGFSPVGIGQTPETDDEGRALLNEQNGTFEWTDPNGLYHVTFQISGVIAPKGEEPENGEQPEQAEEGTEPDADTPEEGENAGTPEDADTPEEGNAGEPENTDAEGEPENLPEADIAEIPVATANLLSFNVEMLGEEDEAFAEYVQAAEENTGDLLGLSVVRYGLTYGDIVMDLSGCKITITVTPTMQLETEAETYILENPIGDGESYVEEEGAVLPAPDLEAAVEIKAFMRTVKGLKSVAGMQLSAADAEVSETVTATLYSTASTAPAITNLMDDLADPSEDMDQMELAAAAAVMPCADEFFVIEVEGDGENILGLSIGSLTNPTYTVQYYAWLEVIGDSGTNTSSVKVIDTSRQGTGDGGSRVLRLKNGVGADASPTGQLRRLYIDNETGKVTTKEELTEVYIAKNCEYFKQPSVIYADKLRENDNYTLAQIWVLKDEHPTQADSIEEQYWHVFKLEDYGGTLRFTNRNTEMDEDFSAVEDDETGLLYTANEATYLYIQKGAVLRFVYTIEKFDPQFNAAFYDYDITEVLYNSYRYTNYKGVPQGINNPSNYKDKTGAHLAFGNANTGTGMQDIRWVDSGGVSNRPNRHNKSAGSFEGCTFGLVNYLKEDGTIQYSDGIAVPNLFNEKDGSHKTTGKTWYDKGEFALQFSQSGDTYTLSAVMTDKGADNRYSRAVSPNLDSFSHPSYIVDGVVKKEHLSIWTNNFWPMDSKPGADGLTGDKLWWDTKGSEYRSSAIYRTHTLRYQSELTDPKNHYLSSDETNYSNHFVAGNYGYFREVTADNLDTGFYAFGRYPASDDSKPHNNMFGMHYVVQFELVKDYCGPLNYYFFGDDDMWVFLKEGNADAQNTGRLICDIGGVHSTVGEYVDLWDYIEGGAKNHETKTYTLYFFYTERGLSGSTCWMQFTLPSVVSITPAQSSNKFGDLRIDKELFKSVNGADPVREDNGETFKFKVEFKNADGKLIDDYTSLLYQQNGNGDPTSRVILWNNSTFELKDGEYIIIKDLPDGATYTITEIVDDKNSPYEYSTVISTGQITRSTEESPKRKDRPGDEQYTAGSSDNRQVSGTIAGGMQNNVLFKNIYTVYKLPKTGGLPTAVYTGAGAMLMMLAAAAYIQRRRKKAADTSAN